VRAKGRQPARVLLFRVIDKRGGGWHPVTGGVDSGESFLEGAQREVEEETSFSRDSGTWVDLEFSYSFQGRFGKAEEHAYGFILKQEKNPKLDSHEHLAYEWVTGAEASVRLGFQPQRDALENFLCYLR